MHKCSKLTTVFFQTLGFSSVTQNWTNTKKSQLVTFHICKYVKIKQGHYKYFSELPLKYLTK